MKSPKERALLQKYLQIASEIFIKKMLKKNDLTIFSPRLHLIDQKYNKTVIL